MAFGAIDTNFVATQADNFSDLLTKIRGMIEVLREHQSGTLPEVLYPHAVLPVLDPEAIWRGEP